MSDDVVADVRRIFDDLDEVAERVESARSAASLRPMGTRAREDAADRERGRVLADGVSGLAKVRAGREVDERRADRAAGDRPAGGTAGHRRP